MKSGGYLRGLFGMAASAFFFSATAVVLRSFPGLSFFVASFYRFAVGVAFLGILALTGRLRLEFQNINVLLLRGLFGGCAVLLFYMSIQKLGIVRGTALSYIYPVFATLGGILFLKQKVRALVWPLLAVALTGMLLLVGVLDDFAFREPPSFWVVLAVAGSVAAGAAVVCIKRLTVSDASTSIFMSQCVVGFWMTMIPANVVPGNPGLGAASILLLLGLLATAGQLLMTWAFNHLPIATGSLLGLLTPMLNLLAGMALFGEKLKPTELTGTALIIGACAAVALLERTELSPD
jgi:drug/metabolite transporter (DMT)-like permease